MSWVGLFGLLDGVGEVVVEVFVLGGLVVVDEFDIVDVLLVFFVY